MLGSAKRWAAALSIVATAAFAGLAARATHGHSTSTQSGSDSQATSNSSAGNSSLSDDSGLSNDSGSGFFGGGSAPSQSFSPPVATSGGS